MPKNKLQVKVKSLALFEWENKIFVFEMADVVKNDKFYRPIGGTVEFGEQTEDTLVREIKEELGAEIQNIKLMHVFENIFTCDGKPGHEIVFMYKAEFKDKSFYEDKMFWITESDGQKLPAYWIPVEKFVSKELRLVPEELLKTYL